MQNPVESKGQKKGDESRAGGAKKKKKRAKKIEMKPNMGSENGKETREGTEEKEEGEGEKKKKKERGR